MIDTHAHLLSYDDLGREIIKNMKRDNLEKIVTIGTTLEDSKRSVELAGHNENVYATVGIYPEYAETVSDETLAELEALAKNEKVVAIGEIGLDYHTPGFNAKKQREVFLKQLEIADRVGLPFCIHCRGAASDVYEILNSNRHLIKHSGLMHCYSEGKEWFQKFLDLGLYLSFSGNITYKKNDRSFLKDIPLDKILIETDSPYLSPEPVRGTKNEPKNVRFVLDKIALELNLSSSELDKITTQNARRFYFKIK